MQNDIVTYSDQMRSDWGFESPGNLQDALDRIHPEDRGFVTVLIQRSLLHGDLYAAEYRVQHPDGTTIWVVAEGHEHSGEPLRCLVYVVISPRRNASRPSNS